MVNSENFNAYLYNLNLIVKYFIYDDANYTENILTTVDDKQHI